MSREITPTQIAKAISDLLEENEKLQERIDKTIEYIETSKSKTSYDNMQSWVEELYLDDDRCKDLLEILKGENNER